MRLRDYQADLKRRTYAAWENPAIRNVFATMATGGGKTPYFCSIIEDFNAPTLLVAHRQELVAQAALTLARARIPHDIIAPKEVVQQAIGLQLILCGHTTYRAGAQVRVAGVDTLVARGPTDPWFKRVQLIIVDEGHHVQELNKWGKAVGFVPNARGLFVSAHAMRGDRKGLGRGHGGLADALVVGPCAYDLQQRGFLVKYELAGPGSDIDVSEVNTTDSGELNQKKLAAAWHKSKTIVGDIAKHYVQLAGGKLGLTFTVDIEGAEDTVREYKKHDVHAALITGETPISVRGKIMQKYRDRDILQLVSVDVLGEGTDVPGCEVISLARHTDSFQTYSQQVGRLLRVLVGDQYAENWDRYTDAQRLELIAASDKPYGLCIDHVDNWDRHLPLPEMPRPYFLTRMDLAIRKKLKSDAIPQRRCLAGEPPCLNVYERTLDKCPKCNQPPPVVRRGSPEQVDGVLSLFDSETMDRLRGLQTARDADAPNIPAFVAPVVANSIRKAHRLAQTAQLDLRATIALWAAWQDHLGKSTTESYRRFFFEFGTDVLTAQSLNAQDAATLTTKVRAKLDAANIVEAF